MTPGQSSPEIYVIFRVFHLGEQGIGLKVMVDPKGLERGGELEFEADTYTVLQRNPPLWNRNLGATGPRFGGLFGNNSPGM